MNVKLSVKRTFIVNGKTYGSAEELPADIRTAIAQQGNSLSAGALTGARVIFNGREYTDETAMPAEIRAQYRSVMAAAGLEMNPSGCTPHIDAALVSAIQPVSSARGLGVVLIAAVLLALAGFIYLR